ncbi:hypothetical protein NPIL_217701, partial [Nephila pilipes]
SAPSLNCQVELLNPERYNFNILQISTPKTTVSVQEFDEEEEPENQRILEVLPSSISSPGVSQMIVSQNNDKGTKVKSLKKNSGNPAKHLSSNEKNAKLPKENLKIPSVKKCPSKVSPSLKKPPIVNGKKTSNVLLKTKNLKKEKAGQNVLLNCKEYVPKEPLCESPSPSPEIILEPEIITGSECHDVVPDSEHSTQESNDEALSARTESDITEECLDDTTLDYEQDYEDDSEEMEETVIAAKEEIIEDSLEKICHKTTKSSRTKESNKNPERKYIPKTSQIKKHLKENKTLSSKKRIVAPKSSVAGNKTTTENKDKKMYKAKIITTKAKSVNTNKVNFILS